MAKFVQSIGKENNCSKKTGLKNKSFLLNLTIVLLVSVFGVFYLITSNFLSVQGYQVSSLQNKIEELKIENQDLELQAMELRSIVRLEKKMSELGMVKVDKVSHINQINNTVAVR